MPKRHRYTHTHTYIYKKEGGSQLGLLGSTGFRRANSQAGFCLNPDRSHAWVDPPSRSGFQNYAPNNMKIFSNGRETSILQPYFHKIRRLHHNFSMEFLDILSLISHHSIFRFEANQVDTFKQINVEQHNFKLSKNESK